MPGFAAAARSCRRRSAASGSFVKVLASSAVNDGGARHRGDGPRRRTSCASINWSAAGSADAEDTYYCAITSNFDPDAAAAQDPIRPPCRRRLLLNTRRQGSRRALRSPNDLVVHVASMTQIDEACGSLRSRAARVRHQRHRAPLQLLRPAGDRGGAGGLAGPGSRGRGGRSRRGAVRPSGAPWPGPQAALQTGRRLRASVVTLRSSLPVAVGDARAECLATRRGSLLSARYRRRTVAETLRYAYPSELGLMWLRDWRSRSKATVFDAFNLRETDRSMETPAGTSEAPATLPSHRRRRN